ncbi:S1C family serine protease [Calycomorphotria hydatis]|uniref:Periplasmic pH-dependent serine endoprotease DegQ n=1 Tax=Calycomorphotria hydatis TaxID=2528027 RepID=A0A517T7S8_9PLAN|nr:trypsin-like peptidase domain-containing protein [Calycomorphotria hydatis]QDT64422.1 Periplasmic pH-dependent serine endoprotease DegQ precursor [Calycomorphotria hydatis]
MSFLTLLTGIVCFLMLSVCGEVSIAQVLSPLGPQFPQPNGTQPPLNISSTRPSQNIFNAEGLTPDEVVNVRVYDTCNRGVVNIETKSAPRDRFLFAESNSDGAGSGSVIDQEGHILTNFHVVEDASQVDVTLFDGSSFPAKFVGADPINDLAVIRIEAPKEKLFPIRLGDSNRLRVGMRVFAIGNPFGLERTMTTGIISSLNRSLQIRGNRTIKSIIQIDAAVNPGNSGGPLLNAHAQLIGVNTAIASRNGQSAGVGFAIPSSLATRVIPQLIKHGRVIRPEIGIVSVLRTERGLLIARLSPGGPAEQAGLRGPKVARSRRGPFVFESVDRSAADIIVGVDGERVTSTDEFLSRIESHNPGETVNLDIIRENQELQIPVILRSSLDEPRQ